jgi:hypothetical protein
MSEETVTFNLEINTEQVISNARKLETILFRLIGILQRMGLSEDITAAMMKIQRLIMIVRILHSALIAMELGNPYTAILAALGIASVSFSLTDSFYEANGK